MEGEIVKREDVVDGMATFGSLMLILCVYVFLAIIGGN